MKISCLTSLRFIAATMIVVHHSRSMLWLSVDDFRGIPLDHAVSFFFILSGFVLAYKYPRLDRASVARFYLARFVRVWPLHFCAFLVLVAMYWPYSWEFIRKDFPLTAANVLLVQGWIPIKEVYFSWNWLSWAVSAEVFFYLLFPVLVRGFERTWKYKLCGSLLLVAILVALCNYTAPPADIQTGILYINPLSRLFEFVLGMATALLWREYGGKVNPQGMKGSLLEAGVFCGTIASIYYASSLIAICGFMGSAGREYLSHTSSALLFAALIFVMANQSGVVSKILQFKPLVLLGEASYVIFIFHQVILRCYKENTAMFSLPEPILYVIFWVILVTFSVTAYRIEHFVATRCPKPV